MSESLNQIEEFVNKKSQKSLERLLTTTSDKEAETSALNLSTLFGTGIPFKDIIANNSDGEKRLISSFNKNLVLLIQKTWVEKSDEELKAQVLYQLERFCSFLESKNFLEAYPLFFSIVENVVYLMFGTQAKSKDFSEYALRIDPEFGIFWWYFSKLPREVQWAESKTRTALLLGMYFLANY